MIAFTTSLVAIFPGGLGLAAWRRVPCSPRFPDPVSPPWWRSLDHDAGDGRSRLSTPLRCRRDLDLRRAWHPGAAVDHSGAVRVSTNTSIGALFMAGIVPGVMLASMLAAVTWFIAWRNDYPRMAKATFGQQ